MELNRDDYIDYYAKLKVYIGILEGLLMKKGILPTRKQENAPHQ